VEPLPATASPSASSPSATTTHGGDEPVPPSGRPLISVAIVSFNAKPTIQRAIRSVLDQRSRHTELVLVDGGSTDGTLDVIRELAPWPGRWLSEPDRGIYDAMNKAMTMARGDWLLFLGADDELLGPIEELVSVFSDPRAVYYGDVEIRQSGVISGGRFSAYRLMQQNICHQAIFYPRAIYSQRRYDTACGMLADHKYNLELWGSCTPFVYLDRRISRFDDRGASAGGDPRFEAIKLATIRESFGLPMYLLKRCRTAAVRLLKPRRGTA
jgi:glycosyltransferase involved in cell wall biosynthesis